MLFRRMIMERESPEELGYDRIKHNLSESSVADRRLSEIGVQLDDLLLFYGNHSGVTELRELIGREQYGLGPENVLLCGGACMALFVVNATLLAPGDRILVVQPNYATNVEVPRSLAIGIDKLELLFDRRFELDLDELESRIGPRTRLISVTWPHNPSGVSVDRSRLVELVRIAERHGCHLLVDETYRELTHGEKLPPAATLSPLAISVESVSKAYGVPGIRIGWIANQDPGLMQRFLAAKEQIVICNSVVDERIALEVMRRKAGLLGSTKASLVENFSILREWMAAQEMLEWIEPTGGVVCFPRFRKEAALDLPRFYRMLLEEFGTLVGPGRWFEEDDRYFRIGYGWPTSAELRGGLHAISEAARAAEL